MTLSTETVSGERLEPCPFCGGVDLAFHQDFSEDEPRRAYAWHVFCRDCHCHGRNNFPIGWVERSEDAVEAWTRRALSPSHGEAVAWRVRERPGFDWRFVDGDPDRDFSLNGFEKQPLYLSPANGAVK